MFEFGIGLKGPLFHRMDLSRQNRSYLLKIGPAGPILAENFAKIGPPGPCTFAAKIGPAGQVLAAKTGTPLTNFGPPCKI